MQSISVEDLQQRLTEKNEKEILIDVREIDEYEAKHIPGAKNIPLSTFNPSFEALKDFDTVYVQCQAGGRSARACGILEAAGVNACNVDGGIGAWERAGFEVV